MANDRLKTALQQADLTHEQFAEIVGVDPKTVQRWIAARTTPYARHRAVIARALDLTEHELWPDQTAAREPEPGPTADAADAIDPGDVISSWGRTSALRKFTFVDFIASARHAVDLLDGGSRMLQADGVIQALADRSTTACEVRVVANERHDQLRTLDRDVVRIDETVFLHAVLRRDDEMIVALSLAHGGQPPVLHLRRLSDDGVFDAFTKHFDSTWSRAAAYEPQTAASEMADRTPRRRWPGRVEHGDRLPRS